MTYPPPMGATDHYAPATSLLELWLKGSPQSLKAQELALEAIGQQLRAVYADYQQVNRHIAEAYPAGAGALAVLDTAQRIGAGLTQTNGTLSGGDQSLASVIGRAGTQLASSQTSTSTIKIIFDAIVQALESNPYTSWAAPGVAYAGTFAQLLPAAVQLMEMYNTISTFVDNIDPDEQTSQVSAPQAGMVGSGYQVAGYNPGQYGTSPYGTSPYGSSPYGTSPYGAGTDQGSMPTGPWMDTSGQWHYPPASQVGAAGTAGYGTGAYGNAGYGNGFSGSDAFGGSLGGGSGSGMSGGALGGGMSGGTSGGTPTMPGLDPTPTDLAGWEPTNGSGSDGTGDGSGGGSGAGDSGTGEAGGHGSGHDGGDHGGNATADTGSAGTHHDSGEVTVTIADGDSSMTVTTDRDGHFAGTLNGRDVNIDVDLVETA